MIAFAQLLKLSAEQNYISTIIDKVEHKIDSQVFNSTSSHPHVMST